MVVSSYISIAVQIISSTPAFIISTKQGPHGTPQLMYNLVPLVFTPNHAALIKAFLSAWPAGQISSP